MTLNNFVVGLLVGVVLVMFGGTVTRTLGVTRAA